MTSVCEVRKAQRRFQKADDAYSVELKRVYGSNAGTMRYLPIRHTDEALIASRIARDEAQDAWHAAMRPAQDLTKAPVVRSVIPDRRVRW